MNMATLTISMDFRSSLVVFKALSGILLGQYLFYSRLERHIQVWVSGDVHDLVWVNVF